MVPSSSGPSTVVDMWMGSQVRHTQRPLVSSHPLATRV
jgi:hypothetical protein